MKPKSAAEAPTQYRPHLPILLALFVGSGCAALIYEIIWFQLLQLVIGASSVSLGVLLGTFMGGMCLGSLLLPRMVSTYAHPLRVYAYLELGIAACGALVLFFVPLISRLYTSSVVDYGPVDILLRGLVCAICLLPPTLLMGATLPGVARWVESTPHGVSWLGFFYGGNIAGAVFGCLLAAFYLLRLHDTMVATLVAMSINIGVASIALGLASVTRHTPDLKLNDTDAPHAAPGSWAVYLAIGLSGMAALGSEVVWTRLLSLMLGATVYTFSIILAVFLVGLGLGSSAGAYFARTTRRPRFALGVCQALLLAAVWWTAFQLTGSLPKWPVDSSLSYTPWQGFQLDIVRAAWAVLPAAVLWGASFPLALAAVAAPGADPGRLVGGVYAANTIGAITGAIAFSMIIIGHFGTQDAERCIVAINAVAALVMFAMAAFYGGRDETESRPTSPAWEAVVLTPLVVIVAIVATVRVPPTPWILIAEGRTTPHWSMTPDDANVYRSDPDWDGGSVELVESAEGPNASIAVTKMVGGADNSLNFHVSGKIVASSEPQDMRLQRMLGHIPAMIHPKPEKVLVIGCGAGVTAGSFVVHPSVKKIVICEIEPKIPDMAGRNFGRQNHYVVTRPEDRPDDFQTRFPNFPEVEVIYDDARHYIATTDEKFDIITADPIHPWVKGAAALYSKEFFELCKKRLSPYGIVTQWVPLYESTEAVVKSEAKTFFDVYEHGTMWSNEDDQRNGYDVVMLGQVEPLSIDVDAMQARLDRPDYQGVVRSMAEVGFGSAVRMLATYAGRKADMRAWFRSGELNTDRNMRLQYLAGLGLNQHLEVQIYNAMIANLVYPEGVFISRDPSVIARLRDYIVNGVSPNADVAVQPSVPGPPTPQIGDVTLGPTPPARDGGRGPAEGPTTDPLNVAPPESAGAGTTGAAPAEDGSPPSPETPVSAPASPPQEDQAPAADETDAPEGNVNGPETEASDGDTSDGSPPAPAAAIEISDAAAESASEAPAPVAGGEGPSLIDASPGDDAGESIESDDQPAPGDDSTAPADAPPQDGAP